MLKYLSPLIYSSLALSLSLFAPTLRAYPDLIRKGYTSCVSCHVASTGGGALTSYGRGFSEELFMFPLYEGSGSFAGIPALDEWNDPTGLFQQLKADVQADWRSVTFQQFGETAPPNNRTTIPMEAAVHLALHVGKTTDLVLSYGQYGPLKSLESRNHYLQVRMSKYLSFRAGRFLPGYGLNLDDHTAFIRSGLGFSEGHEALAIEAVYEDENISSTLTRIVGESVEIVDSNRRWSFDSETREGVALRSALKVGTGLSLGVSVAYDNQRRIFGGFVSAAPIKNWLYILAEVDDWRSAPDDLGNALQRQVGFLRVGSEVWHGLVVGSDLQMDKSEFLTRQRYSIWTQIIPLPHIELRLEGRRSEDGLITGLIMGHVWL